jgi:hypothetical protein
MDPGVVLHMMSGDFSRLADVERGGVRRFITLATASIVIRASPDPTEAMANVMDAMESARVLENHSISLIVDTLGPDALNHDLSAAVHTLADALDLIRTVRRCDVTTSSAARNAAAINAENASPLPLLTQSI